MMQKFILRSFTHGAPCITSAEFSFNNDMHKQIDGVAMGSPHGPALANIFVVYYENKLLQTANKSFFCTRYVDDTFSIFRTEADADQFFLALKSLHPALKFTMEKEANQTLSFLDVKVDKSEKHIKHQYTESLHSLVATCVGILLHLPSAKRT